MSYFLNNFSAFVNLLYHMQHRHEVSEDVRNEKVKDFRVSMMPKVFLVAPSDVRYQRQILR